MSKLTPKWSNLFPFVYKLKTVNLNVTLMPLMAWLLEKQLESTSEIVIPKCLKIKVMATTMIVKD